MESKDSVWHRACHLNRRDRGSWATSSAATAIIRHAVVDIIMGGLLNTRIVHNMVWHGDRHRLM